MASDARSRTLAYVGLVAALACGAVCRFWHLTSQSIFLDEAFTFDAARRPLHELLVQIAYHDAHPPLFYLMTHFLLGANAVADPLDLRVLTASFGLLTILATWGIGRRLYGDGAAVFAALFVATAPSLVELDRLYRMYAILAALSALSWWLLIVAPARRGVAQAACIAGYVVSAALLPSIQYLGGAVVLTQIAYALLAVRTRLTTGMTLGAAVVAGACLSFWVVWALPVQFGLGGYAGVTGMRQDWWEIPSGVLGYGLPLQWYSSPAFGVTLAIASIAAVVAGAWLARRTALPWYLLPIALQGAAFAATGKDLLLSRYLAHLIPAIGLAIAGVASHLARSPLRIAAPLVIAASLAINGVATTNLLLDPMYQTPDWNLAGRIVADTIGPGDAIILDDGYPFLIVREMPAFAGRAISAPTQAGEIQGTLAWIDARPKSRIWYVENQYYYPDPGHRVLSHLAAARKRLRQWVEPRADLANEVYIALFGPEIKKP
jgi:4-amino-4-deoxy-L-arabinose transferase-like glycosyltransferase